MIYEFRSVIPEIYLVAAVVSAVVALAAVVAEPAAGFAESVEFAVAAVVVEWTAAAAELF